MPYLLLLECWLSGYVNPIVKSGIGVIDVEIPGTIMMSAKF